MLDLLDLVEERCEFAIQKLTKQPSNSPRKPNNQHRKTSAREREQSEPSLTTRKQPLADLSVDERVRLLTAQLNNSLILRAVCTR